MWERTISKRTNLKKDNFEKEQSGKGQVWKDTSKKGQWCKRSIWKQKTRNTIMKRKHLENDNSEKQTVNTLGPGRSTRSINRTWIQSTIRTLVRSTNRTLVRSTNRTLVQSTRSKSGPAGGRAILVYLTVSAANNPLSRRWKRRGRVFWRSLAKPF